MSWPDDDIEELVKGERPTLLEAVKGNEVIDALNVLGNMTIERGTEEEVQYSEDGVKIIYGGGEGLTIKIHFVTTDPDSGASIPHTFQFTNGILTSYDESS